MDKNELSDKLANLTDKPGVYLMKDEDGKVIYVGKAVNLKNRVRSYFNASNQNAKVQVMVPKITDIETIVTDSELEALILENNLIKKYRPRYNVIMRDDKNYPYLKISTEEKFPRLLIRRNTGKQGRYFGPYPNAGAVRETIKLLRKLFPVRTCKGETPRNQGKRPCLNYFINRCKAPCNNKISEEEYREMIDKIITVLEGKEGELLKELEQKMHQASESMEFEQAAEYRNQKSALEKIRQKQKIVSERQEDYDIIALGTGEELEEERGACVQIFYIRAGKLMGRNNFRISIGASQDHQDMLTSFIKQYYSQATEIPKQILVSHHLNEQQLIQDWLGTERDGKVEIRVPQRGEKYQMMKMAIKNAELELSQTELDSEKEKRMTEGALKELALRLSMTEIPFRLEGYDISHTQGQGTVASMVVFEGGRSKRDDYRRFKIRTTQGPDDFKAMAEVLRRRFNRARREEQELYKASESPDGSEEYDGGKFDASEMKFAVLPDLIVIDGGRGQLNSALQVLQETGYDDIPIISLAKQEEEIYIPGQNDTMKFPANSEALKLLQRVRDESHRFAVTYHRKTRGKANLASILDEIPEIGPKRKQELYQQYGSLEQIKNADPEELGNLPSMNKKAADNLLSYLEAHVNGKDSVETQNSSASTDA